MHRGQRGEIALAAGVGRTTLYDYFTDRDDLIATLVEVDRIAFGISAVVGYMALLAWEAVSITRDREREPSWRK